MCFFFLFGQPIFPERLGRPLSNCAWEEGAEHAGLRVLVEVDDMCALILAKPQRIWGQQLRPHTVHLLNIIILLVTYLLII